MMIRVYVVTHKKYRFPKADLYQPIIAGAFEYEEDAFPENYIRDNTQISISEKHDVYSEFTALYWVWKNSSEDIVGINHYRRYFIRGGWGRYLLAILNPKEKIDKLALNKEDLSRIFDKGYDCVLPKKQWRVKRTLKDEFVAYYGNDLMVGTENVIRECFPDYYDVYSEILNCRENYQKCICIMKRDSFDRYVSWMFTVFSELEKRGYGRNAREFAFLGERLMNVWVEYERKHNALRVKELFYINTETKVSHFRDDYTEYYVPRFFKPLFLLLMKIGLWKYD